MSSMSLNFSTSEKVATASLPQVEAELQYLVPMTAKPVNYTYEPPIGIPRSNGTYKAYKVRIQNARSIVQTVSLDQHGFAFVNQRSSVQNFYDDEEIRRVYYPEAAQLLADITGATRVLVFDHNVRNLEQARRGENNAKEPVKRVHNDFTARSGYSRAQSVLSSHGIEDADALLQQRFAIINVWRPIAHPVQESPLAVCAAPSIAPSDWVASDLVYRDRIGETYHVTYNPAHQWFYFPQMQPDEALLIKCFDAATDAPARFTAHTAFDDPTSPANATLRASIELRSLVFYGK
jgi:hypothetical protein